MTRGFGQKGNCPSFKRQTIVAAMIYQHVFYDRDAGSQPFLFREASGVRIDPEGSLRRPTPAVTP